MTKKELAIIEELKVKCALSWPTYPKPTPIDVVAEYHKADSPHVKDRLPSRYSDTFAKYAVGFTYSQGRVIPAWYDGFYGTGAPYKGCSGGRTPIPIFATKLEAVQYRRWELSEECAKQLFWLDEKIEEVN